MHFSITDYISKYCCLATHPAVVTSIYAALSVNNFSFLFVCLVTQKHKRKSYLFENFLVISFRSAIIIIIINFKYITTFNCDFLKTIFVSVQRSNYAFVRPGQIDQVRASGPVICACKEGKGACYARGKYPACPTLVTALVSGLQMGFNYNIESTNCRRLEEIDWKWKTIVSLE